MCALTRVYNGVGNIVRKSVTIPVFDTPSRSSVNLIICTALTKENIIITFYALSKPMQANVKTCLSVLAAVISAPLTFWHSLL